MPIRPLTEEAPVYRRPVARAGRPRGAAGARREVPQPGRPRAARCERLLATPELAQQGVDLAPVRPHGAHQHGARARAATPPCCCSRARRPGSPSPPTSTRSTAALDPRRGRRARRSPRRCATSPASAPSRSASPTASTSATPSGRRSPGSSARRCAASPRPAARSACRWSRATSPSTTRPRARSIHPTPTVGMVGVIPSLADLPAPQFHARRATASCCCGDGPRRVRRLGLPAAALRHRAGPAAGGRSRRRARPRRGCCGGWSRGARRTPPTTCSEGGFAVALAEACFGRGGWAPPWTSRCRMAGADLLLRDPGRGRSSPAVPGALDAGAARRPRRRECRRGRSASRRRRTWSSGRGGEILRAPVADLHEIWSTALPRALGAGTRRSRVVGEAPSVVRAMDISNAPTDSLMCGIFGIDGCDDAANLTYLGLYALQHRGQESAGIVSWDGAQLHVERGMGHVSDIFKEKVLARLPGRRAPSATPATRPPGISVIANAQPIVVKTSHGTARHRPQRQPGQRRRDPPAAGARGLDLPDHQRHRGHPPPDGAQPAARRRRVASCSALEQVRGAYSLLLITDDCLIAARDPNGFRPLLPRATLDGCPCFASESCAFDLLGGATGARARAGRGGGRRATAAIESYHLRAAPRAQRAASSSTSTSRAPTAGCSATRCPQVRLRHGRAAGARGAGGGRHRGAGARQRALRRARLQPRVRAAARVRPDPQPLRGAHLHRAQAVDPPLRGEDQAQPGARADRRQAGGAGRRLDRARHHLAQDRAHDPRRRRRRGPRPHLGAADRVALPLRHRHPDPRRAHRRRPQPSRRSAASSRPTASPTSRSTACSRSVSGPRDSYCTACWTGDYRVPISAEDKRQAELFPIRAEDTG